MDRRRFDKVAQSSILRPMHPSFKSIALALAKFSVPSAIIAFLLWRIGPEEWSRFASQPKDYTMLAGALMLALVSLSFTFFRWGILVRCQGIQLSMVEAFRLGSICFLLSFVSAGSVGGDLFKAIFLAQRSPGKRLEAVASVLVDRGVGLYGLVLLVSTAFFWTGPGDLADENLKKVRFATISLVILGTVVLAILVFGGNFVDLLMQRLMQFRWIGRVFVPIAGPLRMFHSHKAAFAASILLSVLVHAGLTLSLFLIARGLYPSTPTLADHFVIVPIGMLASALPIAPAGLGVLELAMEWLYHVIPSEPTPASGTLVALVFEMVKLLTAVIGIIFYWTAGDEVRQSLEIAENET